MTYSSIAAYGPASFSGSDWVPSGLSVDTTSYLTRLSAAGGSLDTATISLIDEYWAKPMKLAGLSDRFKVAYLFVGSGQNTQKVPFYGSTNGTPVGTVDGDFTANGFTGNGSSKYMNLGVSPNGLGLPIDDMTLITYGVNLGGVGTYGLLTATGPGALRNILYREGGDQSYRYDADSQAASVAFLVTAVNDGFVAGHSPSGAFQRIWLDEVPFSFDPGAPRQDGGASSTGNLLALAYDNAGSVILHSPATLRFLAVAEAPTDAEMRKLYHIVDQLNARLGRAATGNTAKSLIVTSPEAYQIFQRNGSNQANILIEGYYSGAATTIEARWNGGSWQAIAFPQRTGLFRGTLLNQNAGQGTLDVRQVNTGNTVSKTFVGVGDIFFCAGQSNSAGQFSNAQSYSHATLKASMFQKYRGWQELADPTGAYIAGGSVWPRLASLHMADQNVPVGFVTMGVGSTQLVGGQWDKDIGVSFDQARYILTQIGSIPKAILWYQGESDTITGATQAQYLAALQAMRQAFSDAAGTQIPLMAVQIGYIDPSLNPTGLNAIRAAIAESWNLPNFLWGFPAYDRNLSTGAGGDGLHWRTDADAIELAARYWRAIKAQFFGGTEGRAPEFLSASFSGDQINILVQYGFGTLSFDTSGFEITDGNGARSVINAGSITGGFSLTIDQPLLAPVTVSFAKDNTGVGSGFRDNGTISRYRLVPFLNKSVAAA